MGEVAVDERAGAGAGLDAIALRFAHWMRAFPCGRADRLRAELGVWAIFHFPGFVWNYAMMSLVNKSPAFPTLSSLPQPPPAPPPTTPLPAFSKLFFFFFLFTHFPSAKYSYPPYCRSHQPFISTRERTWLVGCFITSLSSGLMHVFRGPLVRGSAYR